MKNFMIILLVLCLVGTIAGTLMINWWLGIVPLFVALIPAVYFGVDTDYKEG